MFSLWQNVLCYRRFSHFKFHCQSIYVQYPTENDTSKGIVYVNEPIKSQSVFGIAKFQGFYTPSIFMIYFSSPSC